MLFNDLYSAKKNYLYEGLDTPAIRSVMLWENAGRTIKEAALTADQINQIFTAAEQGATAGGANRTMIGKGKDAASAVNTAWEDLKTKVQNSGPVKNVDAMYDQAADKLKQATGGDQGVMQYVQKYRDFAKKHPVAQSLIYSALIAAAGISGVGAGGAAALGLFKLVDKLLQGEKFSSAAYSGAKTGAVAYGAGQIGKALQGGDQTAAAGNTPGGQTTPGSGARADLIAQKVASANSQRDLVAGFAEKMGMSGANPTAQMVGGVPVSINGVSVPTNLFTPDQLTRINAVKSMSNAMNESQIKKMFVLAETMQSKLNEGVMDTIKGAAGKAMQYAQTKGANLTNKVTADKLMTAWKKAGSPLDSEQVKAIMKQVGVADNVIASAMDSSQGGATAAPVTPSAPGGAGAFGQMASQLTSTPTKSSTGGTISKAGSSTIHSANPNNPNQAVGARATPTATATTPATPTATATTPATPTATPTATAKPANNEIGTQTGAINPKTGRAYMPSDFPDEPAATEPTGTTPPEGGVTAPGAAPKPLAPAGGSRAGVKQAKQAVDTAVSTIKKVRTRDRQGAISYAQKEVAAIPNVKTAPATAAPTATPAATPTAPTWTGRTKSAKVSAPPSSGAPTADERAKLDQKIQAALAKQPPVAESLTWSKSFDPSRSLLKHIKRS
jgi:hypothetical protein